MHPCKHYFIRHAHRKEFNPNDWGDEVSITRHGQKTSKQLGRILAKSQIKAIWTSPIKRCVQTAEEIKNGMGIDIPIYSSSLLGDPGFMISNSKLAEDAFRKYQLIELADLLLRGKSLPGFYPINEGCSSLLKKLLKNKQFGQVWISHDINICVLACWIFRRNRPENMIPEFLEGIEFSYDEIGVFAHFRGLRTKIDDTILRGTLDSIEKPAFSNNELNSSKVRS